MLWMVSITKKEFDDAKAGSFVIAGAFPKGKNLGVVILGNRELSRNEIKEKFHGILANGDDVYYINISDWDWEQLDKPELDRVPHIRFSDGVGFTFLSKEALKRIKEEVDEDGEGKVHHY